MKVELLVNLKVGSGRVISAGSVFSDANAPIPDFIMRRLKRGQARVLPEVKSLPTPPLEVKETSKKKPGVKKPGAKKLLKKKAEPSIS